MFYEANPAISSSLTAAKNLCFWPLYYSMMLPEGDKSWSNLYAWGDITALPSAEVGVSYPCWRKCKTLSNWSNPHIDSYVLSGERVGYLMAFVTICEHIWKGLVESGHFWQAPWFYHFYNQKNKNFYLVNYVSHYRLFANAICVSCVGGVICLQS